MPNNRIYKEKVSISYKETIDFFEKRAAKYNEETPYTVTMYQDNNPQIAIERDRVEKEKILPKLKLNSQTKVLDIGCGIGRWGEEVLKHAIDSYCGIDASEGLLEIAKSRLSEYKPKVKLVKALANDLGNSLIQDQYNTFIIAGVFAYLNDEDIDSVLMSMVNMSSESAQIYIREPICLEERLTLDKFYSEDLKDNYSVIYRSASFFEEKFRKTLLENSFSIVEQGFLFESGLNNRKDTAQYYYIMERR